MGMYTELVLKVRLTEDTPRDILNHMFGDGPEPVTLPDHDFFKSHRWSFIGKSSSFYHHPEPTSSFPKFDYTSSDYLFSRSDLKNYGNEIALFMDWLQPYIDAEPGYCVGWEWYEEDNAPTLLYKK